MKRYTKWVFLKQTLNWSKTWLKEYSGISTQPEGGTARRCFNGNVTNANDIGSDCVTSSNIIEFIVRA